MAVGNHDLSANDYKTQAELFIKYANTGTGKVYYDRMINGYHYIFLGSEKQGLRADLSEAQLKWFDELLAKDTAANPEKPVFVMLHQSLYNTVAGSLPGQNWDGAGSEGTAQAKQLRAILKKYPQVLMFNGHSHWELNSEKCMYARDEELPNIFNTAAVGYLWSSYDDIVGSYTEGSNGYVIKVYKDKVMVLGRDFENGKYVSSAMFVAQNYKK
jgi:Icc protein